MLIKTQLRLAALLPAVFALLIGCIFWGAAVKIDQAQQDAERADRLLRFNFELNILTQEYLLYGGARVESQLRTRHQSMDELLKSMKFEEPDENDLLRTMQVSHRELGGLYDLLLLSKAVAREQIIGAILVKAQDLRARTKQFTEIQYRQVAEIQRRADTIVLVAIIALASMSVILMALMSQRLIQGVEQLGGGMYRVTAGDLDYQIPLSTVDEFGELAKSFNTMSQQLRDSYTSIDNLKDEIARRQHAEMEIHQLNAELEERVHRRTAELEVANQELEAFAYSVSHDLRAPLRAIDGFSRKVVMSYGESLDDEGRRQLQVVRDNARKMGTLIDDLLAFSRMGRREMALQRLFMDSMVKSVADELRLAEPQRSIELVFSPLPSAWGDAAMLRQVWVNLLANAVKFSSQRQVAHIEVGGRNEGGEALYWVKDDGAGFDMQYADKLFGVFQRLHRQDEFEGTGVGLAIAQRILHRHNGRIWGEGAPDAGATFWFTLAVSDSPFSGEHTA